GDPAMTQESMLTRTHAYLPGSEATWSAAAGSSETLPVELTAARPRGILARNRALWQRHAIRRDHAEETLARSLDPERGLPVARPRDVVLFIGGLLRRRLALVIGVVLFNAPAAAAGLAVPMILGRLVDAAIAGAVGNGGVSTDGGVGIDDGAVRSLIVIVFEIIVGHTLF